ncbi:MAG TPA: hypothetical protein VKT33_02670 [Candidatus Angelobacter sp.]|nr:hypothetical protein [Candidatus Angelobacter sp.]
MDGPNVCHDVALLVVLSEYMPQTPQEDLCRRSTRIVIQCIYRQLGVFLCYRVVVYQDGSLFQPLEFSSLDSLIAAFRTINPEFGGDAICQDNSGQTHIVFTKDMLLSRAQLTSLGLKQSNSGL